MKRNNTTGRSLLGLDDGANDDSDAHHHHHISQSEQLLQQHNDERTEVLGEKVRSIRRIAEDIEAQVAMSNGLLDNMDVDMSNVSGLLGRTMVQLKKVTRTGSCWNMVYLVLFMLFVFIILYFMMGTKRSASSTEP